MMMVLLLMNKTLLYMDFFYRLRFHFFFLFVSTLESVLMGLMIKHCTFMALRKISKGSVEEEEVLITIRRDPPNNFFYSQMQITMLLESELLVVEVIQIVSEKLELTQCTAFLLKIQKLNLRHIQQLQLKHTSSPCLSHV